MKRIFKAIIVIIPLTLIIGFMMIYQPDIPVEQLKSTYAGSPSQFAKIDGMDVHYRVQGQGDFLLLLHGTASSLHTWEKWVQILADSFTVVTVDLPAFGLTGPNSTNDYTTKTYNHFINQLADYIGMDSFHIAGNSLGGYISWNYALDYPDRVNKLILIDAAGFPTESVALFKLIKNPVLGPLLSKVSVKSLVKKNMEEVYYDDSKISDALVQRYFDMSLREGNRTALRSRVLRRETSRVDLLEQIKCPTLIMWGEQDLWIPFEHAALFQEAISGSQVVSYSNAGHVPMEELPEESAADAMRFLVTQ